MQTLYEAANAVEAHMLVDLLKQEGVEAHIRGAHLQGALGELPAAGLVRIEVAPEDHARGREVIDRWELKQPATETPARAPSRLAGARWFMVGLVVGASMAYAFFHAPLSVEGNDYNRDGVLDERWTYAPGGMTRKLELDRNFDKKIDHIAQYDARGHIESATSDDDFNGSFESSLRYRWGNVEMSESDIDGNGIPDVRWNFEHGMLKTIETIEALRGTPSRVESFKLSRRVSAEVDTDNDGKLDTLITYTTQGVEASTQPIGR